MENQSKRRTNDATNDLSPIMTGIYDFCCLLFLLFLQRKSVIGSTVKVKGQKTGTITDLDGHFTIVEPMSQPFEENHFLKKKSMEKRAKDSNKWK